MQGTNIDRSIGEMSGMFASELTNRPGAIREYAGTVLKTLPAIAALIVVRFGIDTAGVSVQVVTIGRGAKMNYEHGIDSFLSILDAPCSLAEAIENAPTLLKHAAERTMRFLLIGRQIGVRAALNPQS